MQITLGSLPQQFMVKGEERNKIQLGTKKSRNDITIASPFIFDKRVAKLVGMMADGCLSKDLSSVGFSQKKDLNKIYEFKRLIIDLFDIEWDKMRTFFDKTGSKAVQIPSRPLALFFYYCLNIAKSDESQKVPKWVLSSPRGIVKAYVREIFAMEGSVCDPKTRRKEVRLHSCDLLFVKGSRQLLRERLGIASNIFTYHIKRYGNKYYLTIKGRENLLKLRDVGIALESHQQRLNEVCESYRPEAWKVTLVAAKKLPQRFTIESLTSVFGISRRTTWWRAEQLVKKGLAVKDVSSRPFRYSLTEQGAKLATLFSSTVAVQLLRTNPRENERKVKAALNAGLKTKYDVARFTDLSLTTVSEVLARITTESSVR
ncbi:MAG: LAGLIDADG family homing endonuclease [Candidatus Hadarchaeota archaeon]|nr:LAGLIDADG family homing endonuclease [Candidatus Hadarchaeota archaeon]